jgi:hypothetical protein
MPRNNKLDRFTLENFSTLNQHLEVKLEPTQVECLVTSHS